MKGIISTAVVIFILFLWAFYSIKKLRENKCADCSICKKSNHCKDIKNQPNYEGLIK